MNRPTYALALLLLVLPLAGCPRTEPPPPPFVAAMNEGKAYLENKDSAAGIAAFRRAVETVPDSAAAWRNLARAQLLAREHAAALDSLATAEELEEDSPATEYLTGLALAREGRFAEAIPRFEAAVRLDPGEAPLRFQLANAYQAEGRDDASVEQLEETVRLDPLHSSAVFKLATYARQAGDRDESARLQQEFLRLREVLGDAARSAEALETSVYTLAETVEARTEPAAAAAEDSAAPTMRLVTGGALGRGGDAAPASAVAVLSVDEHGRPTLAVAHRDGALSLVRPTADGSEVHRLPVRLPFEAHELLAGNVYDPVPEGERYDPRVHARNDLLAIGPRGARLLLGADGAGGDEAAASGPTLVDVTDGSGLGDLVATAARWVDVEHDGDLDLAAAGPGGLAVYQNNGDGTFTEVTAELGLEAGGAAVDVAAIDFDGDVAVDLVVAHEDGTRVWINQRTGRFEAMAAPPGPWPAARRVLADDWDNDGTPEALLLGGDGEVGASGALLHPGEPAATDLGFGLEGGARARPVTARLDLDNDGWLDLVVAGGGRLHAWRNLGAGGWRPLAETPDGEFEGLAPADLDGDGDTDLAAVTPAGLVAIVNQGGNANRRLVLRLNGTKTNPAGLGTRIEVRNGLTRISRWVDRPLVEIGVGDAARLDSVQTLWTNGVVDNQIGVEVAAGTPTVLTIDEKNVATGSCPFLYVWDGTRFDFVTDLLGNSPVGLSLTRDRLLPADPDELVVIGDGSRLAPRDGRYELEVTSEFREILYLDTARLIAVDHPPGTEVGVTDKLMPPPFPATEPRLLGHRRPLLAAVGDDGVDRTAELAEHDGTFAPGGVPLPPPYRGMTEPLALTLDFGRLDGLERPVLALTGWLQWGDASTNIAASQNRSLTVVHPRLEAQTAAGWRPVDVVVGLPAGKTKTILVDLAGRLPEGTRRLRLTTTFEVRWDRAALFERLDDGSDSPWTLHELEPSSAELYERGFSDLRQRAPRHPTTPRYEEVSAQPPWRTTPSGWSTRYGAVGELVAERDGRVAIVNAGDAVRLGFDAAALPPVPEGRQRTFLFFSVGWDKDGDHNVVAGDRVEPLPEGTDPDPAWQRRWNTRWVPPDKHGVR